jgi:hypothetical protein
MSNQFLKLRRSAVPGRVPSTSSIDFGEIDNSLGYVLPWIKMDKNWLSSIGTHYINDAEFVFGQLHNFTVFGKIHQPCRA